MHVCTYVSACDSQMLPCKHKAIRINNNSLHSLVSYMEQVKLYTYIF